MSDFENGTAGAGSGPAASSSDSSRVDDHWSPFEGLRRIALAGIGAVSVASEVSDEVFSELVKRGEQSREEARDELRQAKARTARRNADAADFFRARMNGLMDRVNLPSKGDVDSINAKLNILTRKMDEFQSAQVIVEEETIAEVPKPDSSSNEEPGNNNPSSHAT
jgi:poly(hydroxyalkanoate) granule-associated protein